MAASVVDELAGQLAAVSQLCDEADAQVAEREALLEQAVAEEAGIDEATLELAASKKLARGARRAVLSAKLELGAAKNAEGRMARVAAADLKAPPASTTDVATASPLSPSHSRDQARELREAMYLFRDTCSEFTGTTGIPFALWLRSFEQHLALLPSEPSEQLRMQLLRGRVKAAASQLLDSNVIELEEVENFLAEQYPVPSRTTVLLAMTKLEQHDMQISTFGKKFRAQVAALAASGLPMGATEQMEHFIAKVRRELRVHIMTRRASTPARDQSLAWLIDTAAGIERDIGPSPSAVMATSGQAPYRSWRSSTDSRSGSQRGGRRNECKDGLQCELVMSNTCEMYHPRCPKHGRCERMSVCHLWHSPLERARAASASASPSASAPAGGTTYTTVGAFATAQALTELTLVDVQTAAGMEKALQDEGATHNFMLRSLAQELRLVPFPDRQRFHVLNGFAHTTEAVYYAIDGCRLKFQLADTMAPSFRMILRRQAYQLTRNWTRRHAATVMATTEDKVATPEPRELAVEPQPVPTTPMAAADDDEQSPTEVDVVRLTTLRGWAERELKAVDDDTKPGGMRVAPVTVRTTAHEPVVVASRKYSPFESKAITDWVADSVAKGLIIERPATMARYETNLLPVKDASKPFGYRITQNMAPVNDIVENDEYPIPGVEDALAAIPAGAAVFSVIDLKGGFHQVPLAEQSQALTGFTWAHTSDVWQRVVMGLKCSPGAFQRRVCCGGPPTTIWT